MRSYEPIITRNMALYDQPLRTKDHTHNKYYHSIFKRLLVYEQIPDNDLDQVNREAVYTLGMIDPAFEILLFDQSFIYYIENDRHIGKWQKVAQDYRTFTEQEKKRRVKHNPYHRQMPDTTESWRNLPTIELHRLRSAWQYDAIYKMLSRFIDSLYDFNQTEDLHNKDNFRLKVNSVLAIEQLIIALNSNELTYNFVESEINLVNIKISLDAFKLAYTFIMRANESLHKIRWSSLAENQPIVAEFVTATDLIAEKLRSRIIEFERLFVLFIDSLSEDQSDLVR